MRNYNAYTKRIVIAFSTISLAGGCAQFNAAVPGTPEQVTEAAAKQSAVTAPQIPAEEERQLTSAQRELRQQAAALGPVEQSQPEGSYDTTVWQTAAVGAVLGAAAGTAVKRDWQGATIGAAGGVAAGYVAGQYLASKQKEYANKEDLLNSMIADVRRDNQQSEKTIAIMQKVVAEDKRKVAELNRKYKKHQITAEQLKKELAVVQKDKEVMNKLITAANRKKAEYEKAKQDYEKQYPGVSTVGFGSEITTYQKRIATMSSVTNRMA